MLINFMKIYVYFQTETSNFLQFHQQTEGQFCSQKI